MGNYCVDHVILKTFHKPTEAHTHTHPPKRWGEKVNKINKSYYHETHKTKPPTAVTRNIKLPIGTQHSKFPRIRINYLTLATGHLPNPK